MAAFKSCVECSGSSAVNVSALANELLKTYSESDYKKCLNGRRLKVFLIQSGNFSAEGDHVTICAGM